MKSLIFGLIVAVSLSACTPKDDKSAEGSDVSKLKSSLKNAFK